MAPFNSTRSNKNAATLRPTSNARYRVRKARKSARPAKVPKSIAEDDTSDSQSQAVEEAEPEELEGFAALPTELRQMILENCVLPKVTHTAQYPTSSVHDHVRHSAIGNTSKTMRDDAASIIHCNAHLIMKPRPDFVLGRVPRSITTSMPIFGRFVDSMHITAYLQVPLQPQFHRPYEPSRITATFEFELDGRKIKITAACDKTHGAARQDVMKWIKKMTQDLKEMMVAFLEGYHPPQSRKLVEHKGSPVWGSRERKPTPEVLPRERNPRTRRTASPERK